MPTAAKSLRASREPSGLRGEIAALSELAPVRAATGWLRRNPAEILRWQREVCSIPAPPFGEAPRAAWLKEKLHALGLSESHIDEAGNVLAVFSHPHSAKKMSADQDCVALIAHMDTVFPKGTAVNIRQEGKRLYGPGASDNGSGLAALMALAAAMESAELELNAPVLFVCTVGEEGEGNLRGVRHLFLDSPWRERIACALVVDGAGTENIVRQALGSRRFEVTLRGPGGHSWNDFGVPNPIAVMARAISDFYEAEDTRAGDIRVGDARRNPPRSAYNVGVIHGGVSVNSIPESAAMRVDLRSQTAAELDRMEAALRAVLAGALAHCESGVGRPRDDSQISGARSKLSVEIRSIGDRPAAELAAGARIGQVVRAVDAQLGIRARSHCSSTDANLPLSLGREALSLGAGGSGGGAHTLGEWFDSAGRELGLERLLLMTAALAGIGSGAKA